MIWYIVGIIVAFCCGAAAVAYPCAAIMQLNACEVGRLERVHKIVTRECDGCSRLGRILDTINQETKL